MGEISAKTKLASDAILRRRRGAVAPFRRDRRTDEARVVPAWGRIVLRTATTTFR
ncbi:MAG: hypothetical protein H7X95_01585 [Deltaproteobacteria bacterium]|nr:hypothetical protein [Deltaproteobacteria bacterium]